MRAQEGEVRHLYAFVSEGEGIVAAMGNNGAWYPLVTYDSRILPIMRQQARNIASLTGKRIFQITADVRSEELVE